MNKEVIKGMFISLIFIGIATVFVYFTYNPAHEYGAPTPTSYNNTWNVY